jgi:hypothetical protein
MDDESLSTLTLLDLLREIYANSVVTTTVTILAKRRNHYCNEKYICTKRYKPARKQVTFKIISEIISCVFHFVACLKLTPRTSSVILNDLQQGLYSSLRPKS